MHEFVLQAEREIPLARGDDIRAIRLLASLPALAHRIDGSHAQRDVLHLTLSRAVERIRRPTAARDVPVLANVADGADL